MITMDGIFYLKFAVSDIDKSVDFYEAVFGAKRSVEDDHLTPDGFLWAVMLDVPGLGTRLQLRLDPAAAEAHRNWNPVALTVDTVEDLRAWMQHLDNVNVPHSPILTGLISWLIVIEDPDQNQLRIYCQERHGIEAKPSRDERWLGDWTSRPASQTQG
jgi:catechol 2,3-dioxygenase-like lactoylglutathione lyase family enzyme